MIGFAGCKTYYILLIVLRSNYGIDSTKLRLVHTRGPVGDIVDYLANPIDYINALTSRTIHLN
jgi:hypothetical protein